MLNEIPVYNFQLGLGTKLAQRVRETGWDVDIVVPVPDGSRPAAIQLSGELGLPYREVRRAALCGLSAHASCMLEPVPCAA